MMRGTRSSARRRTNVDVRADWGPSDNDQRHRLVLSGPFDPARIARTPARRGPRLVS